MVILLSKSSGEALLPQVLVWGDFLPTLVHAVGFRPDRMKAFGELKLPIELSEGIYFPHLGHTVGFRPDRMTMDLGKLCFPI